MKGHTVCHRGRKVIALKLNSIVVWVTRARARCAAVLWCLVYNTSTSRCIIHCGQMSPSSSIVVICSIFINHNHITISLTSLICMSALNVQYFLKNCQITRLIIIVIIIMNSLIILLWFLLSGQLSDSTCLVQGHLAGLGVEPLTLRFTGCCSVHWATCSPLRFLSF